MRFHEIGNEFVDFPRVFPVYVVGGMIESVELRAVYDRADEMQEI
jgi:hypothetical protein